MGLQQSKEELLYQQVNYGNIEGIRTLKAQGAGVEARITISPLAFPTVLFHTLVLGINRLHFSSWGVSMLLAVD